MLVETPGMLTHYRQLHRKYESFYQRTFAIWYMLDGNPHNVQLTLEKAIRLL